MSKRVAIVGCAGIPANYGGFETLVENIVRELKDDFNFIVYCSSFNYPIKKRKSYYNARLIYIPVKANGRLSILYDLVSILNSLTKSDIIVVLGVGGAFLFPFIRFFAWKKKIVVNIDGLEWKRQKWGFFAKTYLRIQEGIAVKFAHRVIADNAAIQSYIKNQYQKDSYYAPYGGDHAFPVQLNESTKTELSVKGGDYFFSVCRIEPENNIHVILEAFASLHNFKLIIVGNWSASSYGKSLFNSYKARKNILLLDPIYNLSKLDEIRSNCLAYVHGHSAGGTNPSLVEAMALGLAVICWDVDYNRYTTENHALYFHNSLALQDILLKIQNLSINLKSITLNLREVAERKYLWKVVAKQYYFILNN